MASQRRGGNEELARAKGRSEKVRGEPGDRPTVEKLQKKCCRKAKQVKNEITCHL